MNDFKVFVKADPSKELPKSPITMYEAEDYLTNKGYLRYEGDGKWYCNNYDQYHKVNHWLKEVSLTELMVGFAEWCADSSTRTDAKWWVDENLENPNTTEEMLKFYLKEKGVVL